MKGDISDQLETPTVAPDGDQPQRRYVEHSAIKLHAVLLFSIVIAILGAMLAILPCVVTTADNGAEKASELSLLLLAIAAGGAGAAVHALTAFAGFAGNRQLTRSWLPWIYLRIPIGSLLAVLVYFGVRAGFFKQGDLADFTNVFVVAFVCALSGMFSKQVADKLSDVIDNLLVPQNKPVRADPLEQTTPAGAAAAQTDAGQAVPEETIQHVQRKLIALGHLSADLADGKSADDGILGPLTETAIEAFLSAEGIVGEVRETALGNQNDPDYWPDLLELLDQAIKAREAP